jgi:hypothetical protein
MLTGMSPRDGSAAVASPAAAVVLLEAPEQPWSDGQRPRVGIPVDRVVEVTPPEDTMGDEPAADAARAEGTQARLVDVLRLFALAREGIERAVGLRAGSER